MISLDIMYGVLIAIFIIGVQVREYCIITQNSALFSLSLSPLYSLNNTTERKRFPKKKSILLISLLSNSAKSSGFGSSSSLSV